MTHQHLVVAAKKAQVKLAPKSLLCSGPLACCGVLGGVAALPCAAGTLKYPFRFTQFPGSFSWPGKKSQQGQSDGT
jgi:hypothetical protein